MEFILPDLCPQQPRSKPGQLQNLGRNATEADLPDDSS